MPLELVGRPARGALMIGLSPSSPDPHQRRATRLLGEVAQYESIFRLCYLRGPAGIIVALAEQIG